MRGTLDFVYLVEEGIDVSFRMGWLRDSTQHAVKLTEFGQCVAASPDYQRHAPRPEQPEALADHPWVAR